VIVGRAGEVVARWTRYDTALITFLLRQRRSERFSASQHFAGLRPGHPTYERLKKEWERERDEEDERRSEADQEFLRKLENRLEAKRRQAIEAGLMRVDEFGRGHWVDPELTLAIRGPSPD
jgi:hypothetical protein